MGCGVHPSQCVGQGGAQRIPCSCDLSDSSRVCKGVQNPLDGARLEVCI
jgi:hypothetical protein